MNPEDFSSKVLEIGLWTPVQREAGGEGRVSRGGAHAPFLGQLPSFLSVKGTLMGGEQMLSYFHFSNLELDFFPPEIRLTIYDTGSPVGPGVPGVYK